MADLRACFCAQCTRGVPGYFSQVSRATSCEHRRLGSGRPRRRERQVATAASPAAADTPLAATTAAPATAARNPEDALGATGCGGGGEVDSDDGSSGRDPEEPAEAPPTQPSLVQWRVCPPTGVSRRNRRLCCLQLRHGTLLVAGCNRGLPSSAPSFWHLPHPTSPQVYGGGQCHSTNTKGGLLQGRLCGVHSQQAHTHCLRRVRGGTLPRT